MKGCDELKVIIGHEVACCSSCHGDAFDYGMEMCSAEYRGDLYEACCNVARAFSESDRV